VLAINFVVVVGDVGSNSTQSPVEEGKIVERRMMQILGLSQDYWVVETMICSPNLNYFGVMMALQLLLELN